MRGQRQQAGDQRQAGQGLVEFSLILPILTILFMAVLEVALMFNAFIGVNRASQNGGHIAATVGNLAGADCLILTEIEQDVVVPNDRARILEVIIERTPLAGNDAYPGEKQRWSRSGSTTCTLPDGTSAVVPYSLTMTGYPEEQRCSVLSGCAALTPPRSTVDNIGVSIRYRHPWVTPLNALFGYFAGGDTGWTFTQRNIFRIEPTL